MTTSSPAFSDYQIFLEGVGARTRGEPRRAPAHLPTGPDSDAALWLAGYDAEHDELATLDRQAAA